LLTTTLFLDQVPEPSKFFALLKSLVLHPVRTLRCFKVFFTAEPMKSFRDYQRLGYHLVEAAWLSFKLQANKPDHLHSHFITGATSINMFLSELIDVPFSFTMHASAIWIDPIALKSKLRRCRFCVSISQYNRQYVGTEYGDEWRRKIHVVHCGIPVPPPGQVPRKPRSEGEPVRVLAVGQLMKRKGYHVLIEAARILRDQQFDVAWTIVGEGNLRPALEDMIRRYRLEDTVILEGAKPHEDIPHYLAAADIFTRPCVIGDDDTRDGIPVSLMEARACRLPVVSTDIVGLPELIDSPREGVLVESGNAQALADAIRMLAESADMRSKIGDSALQKIERDFNSRRSAEQLSALFSYQ
jgi:glycosyltransferase involved in cell wall biosynthesis